MLGPLAENKLFLATDNYGLAWTVRPGVLVLFAVILVGLLAPMVSTRRGSRQPVSTVSPRPGQEGGRRTLRLDGMTAFSLLIVLVFAWALWQSRGFGVRAGLFPWAVCVPGLVLGLVQLTRDLTGRRESPVPDARGDATPDVSSDVAARRTVEICAWIAGFWGAIWLVGFSLATPLMAFLYLRVSAQERWLTAGLLTAFAFALVYGLFETALGVPFPSGQLLGWLSPEGR